MYPGIRAGIRARQQQQQSYSSNNDHQWTAANQNMIPAPQQQHCPPYDAADDGGYFRMQQPQQLGANGGIPNPGRQGVSFDQNYNSGYRARSDGNFYAPTDVNFEPPPQGYLEQTQSLVSSCNGRKKALLIGINYRGTRAELRGCVSDVHYVRDFLCSRYGFSTDPRSMLVLTDDHNDPNFLPLRNNIIQAMHWLARDLRPGDSLFFQFSGHGTRVKDQDGDEDDGYDEAICPLDYEKSGLIIDDEINHILIRCLPPNVRLTAISDSCHSGSVFDLPYTYYSDGKLKVASKTKSLAKSTASGVFDIMTGREASGLLGIFNGIVDVMKMKDRDPHRMAQTKGNYFSDTIMISGCKDTQTSADTVIGGRNTGALTHAFVDALKKNPNPTYRELLIEIRNILSGKYSQKPQLSTGRLIDMNNARFFL